MVRCNKQDSRGNPDERKTFLLQRNNPAFVTSGREPDAARRPIVSTRCRSGTLRTHPFHSAALHRQRKPTMWILAEAPKGSNFFEAQSQAGNKVLLSDSCDTIIYARSQGSDGHRIVAQRGRDTFFLGPPVRGAETDMTPQMLELARKLQAVIPT